MKRIAITLIIGIMLGYMLGLVHQLAQQEQRRATISKMENVAEVQE